MGHLYQETEEKWAERLEEWANGEESCEMPGSAQDMAVDSAAHRGVLTGTTSSCTKLQPEQARDPQVLPLVEVLLAVDEC